MILASREQKGWLKSLGRVMRPKKSYRRGYKYIGKRILRIRASAHALSLGLAIGVFASFSPALGFHFLMALVLAWFLGGNLVAAALGTAASNPLTYPFMIMGNYKVGQLMFGNTGPMTQLPDNLLSKLFSLDFEGVWHPLIKPLLVGSVILGLIFAILTYGLAYLAARTFAVERKQSIKQGKAIIS